VRTKALIKRFLFSSDNFADVTGSGVRLALERNQLELVSTGPFPSSLGAYPATADLFARTRLTNPNTLKQWIGFQSYHVNKTDVNGVALTNVQFKLNDGITDLYWDGGAWSPAGLSDWNTEADIADNIATFPVASQSIQVVINLVTTDTTVTPEVTQVKLLYLSDVEHLQDYVWESLVPDMEAKIRPIGEHHIESLGDATIDISATGDFPIETPYDITAIDAVYDLTADPKKLTDLFSSYDVSNKIVTLTSAPPATNTVLIRFLYKPVVAVNTDQDYIEVNKIPQIIFTDITQVATMENVGIDWVINKSNATVGKRLRPTQSDIEISAQWITDKDKDHARLGDAIRTYFGDNPFLRSVGTDELFRLWLIDEYDQQTSPNQEGLGAGRLRFRIVKALFYDSDAVDGHGVLNFDVSLAT
jgi:hypothetical protein